MANQKLLGRVKSFWKTRPLGKKNNKKEVTAEKKRDVQETPDVQTSSSGPEGVAIAGVHCNTERNIRAAA